jgi:hypothetical protein
VTDTNSPTRVNPRSIAAVEWTLIALGLIAIAVIPKSVAGDARLRYEVLEHFVTTGHLVSPKYSTVGPLLSLPLYLLGRALGAAKPVTAYYNALLFLCALPLIWREFRDELAAPARRMLLLLLVFASMFAHHVQRYYGEVFSALFITIGVFWLSRGHGLRGWAAIVLGAINSPACLVGVAGVSLCHARRTRSGLPLLGPLVAFGLIRLESLWVRGSLFDTGYNYDSGFHTALPYSGLPNFSYPFFFGLLAILLSFGKGLVFFVPAMFLPLPASAPARLRWVNWTLIAFVVGLILTYAKWWSWYGGWFWGPRFFLIASVPACFSLATNLLDWRNASLTRRILTAAALLLSFWVGVNGLVFRDMGLDLCTRNFFALADYCYFVPEMSVLWHPFVDGAAAVPRAYRPAAFVAVGFWAVTLAWVGRALFVDLGRRLTSSIVHWRKWW